MIYFDATCNGDYDKIIVFLQENGVAIASRNKLALLIVVEDVPVELVHRMLDETKFEEEVSVGTKPL